MKYLFSRYSHWLLLIFTIVSSGMGLVSLTKSTHDITAVVFSIIGVAGVTYLCIHIEVKRRKEHN